MLDRNDKVLALVRDEMNMVRTMSLDELDIYVENLIRDRIELNMNDAEIIEAYEGIA